MTRRASSVLVAVATVGAAASVPPAAAPEPARLSLVWVDVYRAAPFAAPAVEREVRALLEPLGMDVRWRSAEPDVARDAADIAVLLVDAEAPAPLRERRVMGAVPAGPAACRCAWVFLPEVLRSLGRTGPAEGLDPAWRLALSRALGRVAAHEVLHLLAPEAPHAPRGIMAAALDRATLLKRSVEVDERTRRELARGSGPAGPEPDGEPLAEELSRAFRAVSEAALRLVGCCPGERPAARAAG